MNDPGDKELTAAELQALTDAKPAWMKDGLGMKGDVQQVSNSKANLVWESTVVYRRPELNASG